MIDMNDMKILEEIKKDYSILVHQIEGASYMLNEDCPQRNFLKYLQSCLTATHNKISLEIKANTNFSPNCC